MVLIGIHRIFSGILWPFHGDVFFFSYWTLKLGIDWNFIGVNMRPLLGFLLSSKIIMND